MNEQKNENVKASADSSDPTITALEKKITMLERGGTTEVPDQIPQSITSIYDINFPDEFIDRTAELYGEIPLLLSSIDDALLKEDYEKVIHDASHAISILDELFDVMDQMEASAKDLGFHDELDFKSFSGLELRSTYNLAYLPFYIVRAESYRQLEQYYAAVRNYDVAIGFFDSIEDLSVLDELLPGMNMDDLRTERQTVYDLMEDNSPYFESFQQLPLQPIQ